MQFSYNKKEKLKSRKLIKHLFDEGNSISVFPLRMVYLQMEHDDEFLLQTSVSVSKRNFKLAVHRNRIKRLMREVYRLNKHILYNSMIDKYLIMFIYLGRKEMDYSKLDTKMQDLMLAFLAKINNKTIKK